MNYCPNCRHRIPKDEPVVGGCPSPAMTAKEIAEIQGESQDTSWYYRLAQFSTITNPPNVRETATELMMLGELGLPQDKALEAVYRTLGNGFFTTEPVSS